MVDTAFWKGHEAAWVLRGLLGGGALYAITQESAFGAGLLLLSLGVSGLMYYVCRHFLEKTGAWMDTLFTLLLVFNNLFGLFLGFYHTVPGWDIATHYTTSAFLGVGALILMQKAYPSVMTHAPAPAVVMGVLLFSLGLGGIWEIGEFASDYLRGTNFQHGLVNTMQDLIVDGIAGLIVGIAWVKRKKK